MIRRHVEGMRGRLIVIGAGAALVVAAACSSVPSDPNTPFAIEFNQAPSPSVVLGQPMFDSLGIVAPLHARVFNSKGDEIVGAKVTYAFAGPDSASPLTINSTTGQVTGKSDAKYVGRTVRVYAQAGKLQSQTTLGQGAVVVTGTRSADTLLAVGDSVARLVLRFSTADSLPTSTISVRLRHKAPAASPADTTVPAYLVRFRIEQPSAAKSDTSYVMLTGGTRRSELDTTDVSGIATRQVRVRRANFPFGKTATGDTIYDTVVVRAAAPRAGATAPDSVPGSGHRFLLIIEARKQ